MNRILISLTFSIGIICLSGCFGSPQAQLEEMVKKESANLPTIINSKTTLVQLEAKPLEVVYTYEVKLAGGMLDKKAMEETVHSELVKKKTELAQQAAAKIKLTYVYRDDKKAERYRFTVNTWEL